MAVYISKVMAKEQICEAYKAGEIFSNGNDE